MNRMSSQPSRRPSDRFGRLDIMFNNVGIPTPRFGMSLEDHSVEDFERLVAVNFRGVFLGCKSAVTRFKMQGGGGVILNTGSVAGLVGWGGAVYGATKGAVHQLTKAVAIEARRSAFGSNAICPAGMPYTGFMAAGGQSRPERSSNRSDSTWVPSHPLGRPITAEDCAEAAVYLVSDRAANVTGVLLPIDGGYVAQMTGTRPMLDVERVRELFDLRGSLVTLMGGDYQDDPYPTWKRLREQAPVHEGTVHDLSGFHEDSSSTAFRIPIVRTFRRSPMPPAMPSTATQRCSRPPRGRRSRRCTPRSANSMLSMGGRRAPALPRSGAAVVCPGQGAVVDPQLDRGDRPRADRRLRRRRAGRAQRRLLRRDPGPDHHRELRHPGRAGPRRPRSVSRPQIVEILSPIVAARREQPQDDLISVLVDAEITDEDG